ncbi:hypothetical protein L7F22_066986 [Adiantum nelumboides]|nr:hypothetical protein [Adiantum nelumboides]
MEGHTIERIEASVPHASMEHSNQEQGLGSILRSAENVEVQEYDMDEDILQWIVDIQMLWDHCKAPKFLQDEMLRRLFSGTCVAKGKQSGGTAKKKSFISLILEKQSLFNGDPKKIEAPHNLDQLLRIYESMGMVQLQRWRLCIGKSRQQHPPKLYEPSKEDCYLKEVVHCLCPSSASQSRLKKDCELCCERCSLCGTPRKHMVSFDYMSIISQLQLLCLSSTFCHEMLAMWRARGRWLGRDVEEHMDFIDEFWDGQKVRSTIPRFLGSNKMLGTTNILLQPSLQYGLSTISV